MSTRRRLLRTGLRLAATAALLFAILQFVSFDEVLSVVGSARHGWLLAAVPLVLLGPVLSAARLGVLLAAQGAKLSLWQIVRINFATGFWKLFLPGTLAGGPIRWLKLSRAGGGTVEPIAAIVYSRIAYMGGMALLGVLFVALEAPGGTTHLALVSLLLFVGLMVALAALLARADRWKLLRRLPGGEDAFPHRLIAAVSRHRQLSGRDRIRVVVFALAENLAGTLVIFFLALALQLRLSFITLGWVRAIVYLITSLSITISGLGVREGGLMVALEPYGVPGSRAVALSLLVLGASVLIAGVGGVLELKALVAVAQAKARGEAESV